MKTKISSLIIVIAGLLSSACQDDTHLMPEPKSGSVSFEVGLDHNIASRAATVADETPVRCLMEVYDAVTGAQVGKQLSVTGSGTYSFTVDNLEKSKEYTFVFWADGGEGAYNTTSLKTITEAADNKIAFMGVMKAKPDGVKKDVTLNHAVSRLVVAHSGNENLTAGDKVTVSFTRKVYTLNVLENRITSTGTKAVTQSATVTAGNESGELITLYMLAPGPEMNDGGSPSMLVEDFVLSYQPKGSETGYKKEFANVPFQHNHRTVLTGNIRAMALGGQEFSIKVNGSWENDLTPEEGSGVDTPKPDDPIVTPDPNPDPDPEPDPDPDPITGPTLNVSAGLLTEAMISKAVGSGNSLKLTGSLADSDFEVLNSYLKSAGKQMSIDLSGTSITELPDDAFYQCTNLINIALPSSVSTIGAYSFSETNITSFSGSGVTTIMNGAFYKCKKLISAAFGNVSQIDSAVFKECISLESVDLSKCTSVCTVDENLLLGISHTVTFYVANSEMLELFSIDKAWKEAADNIEWRIR